MAATRLTKECAYDYRLAVLREAWGVAFVPSCRSCGATFLPSGE